MNEKTAESNDNDDENIIRNNYRPMVDTAEENRKEIINEENSYHRNGRSFVYLSPKKRLEKEKRLFLLPPVRERLSVF